jgi:hypothetical protein
MSNTSVARLDPGCANPPAEQQEWWEFKSASLRHALTDFNFQGRKLKSFTTMSF